MNKLIILLAFIAFAGCNKPSKKRTYSKTPSKKEVERKNIEGKKIMETQCFLCHNASTPFNERIAPPMIEIKAHYIKEGVSKEEFTNKFISFVKNPTKEKAKMHTAVKKFGVMPYQNFKEEDLRKIANYLYNYQIDEPYWFKKYWQKKGKELYINKGKKATKVNQTETTIGLMYALETKKVLGKNLMGTIQKKGTLKALVFCNEKAYSLTDSMSTKFKATIKRVSDKPRNQKNKANNKELAIINQYKKIVSEKDKITPITEEVSGKTQFYYPIITNSMCLQCHGAPKKEIQPTVLDKLVELYPKDKAKGYEVNQVRGVWSIIFDEEIK